MRSLELLKSPRLHPLHCCLAVIFNYVWVYTAMATPAFLRYLPARLKPLSSPAIWAPLTVFALLSIFLWEYHKNPEWFNREQITNANPDSSLTPEEQARLSEIDTIDLLLENARISGADRPAALSNLEGNLDASGAEGSPSTGSLASQENPFAIYEEEYKFPGSNRAAGAAGTAPSSSNFGLGSPPAAVQPTADSALAEAIRQQNAISTGNDSSPQPALSGSSAVNTSPGAIPSSGDRAFSTPGLPPEPASSSGISAPFTQTTTDMSPPVGTTGYQTPASAQLPVFNTPSQQPTSNPFNRQAQPAIPQSGSFQQGSFQPAAPAATPLPGAATPNSNGYTPPRFSQPEQNRRVR